MIRLFRKLRSLLRRRKLLKQAIKFNESRLGRPLAKRERDYLKFVVKASGEVEVIFARGSGKSFGKTVRCMKQMGKTIESISIDEWINEEAPLRTDKN